MNNIKNKNIYVSIDEARFELKKRGDDLKLRKEIKKELGDKFIKNFDSEQRAVLFRQICQADNGFELFFYSAKYIGVNPLVLEYWDDIFVHFNEEKKGLGRLRVVEEEKKAVIDIMNFHDNERKKLSECVLKNGERVIDFHHNLLNVLGLKVDMIDNSEWFKDIGKAKDYYYFLMLHFVADGVLFDVFQTEEDESENVFTNEVVFSAIEKIKKKFGVAPLIVRLYPDNQSPEEDFFWWCYPPNVNNFLINYAKKNNIVFKYLNIK